MYAQKFWTYFAQYTPPKSTFSSGPWLTLGTDIGPIHLGITFSLPQAIKALGNLWDGLKATVAGGAETLGGWFVDAWKAIKWPSIDMGTFWKAVTGGVGGIKWPSIDLTGLWKAVTGAVGKLKEIPIKSLALDVGSFAIHLPGTAVGVASGLLSKLFDVASWIPEHIGGIATAIGKAFDNVSIPIVKFPAHLFGKLFDFAGWFMGSSGKLLSTISSLFDAVSTAAFHPDKFIKNLMGSLFGGTNLGAINVSGLTGALAGALERVNWAGLGGIKDSGVNLVKGLYDSAAAEVKTTFNSLTTDVLNAMGNTAGALKVLGGYGASMVTGWASSMESAVTGSAVFKHLTTDLLNDLGGLTGALTVLEGYGQNLIQGLINGIGNMLDALKKKMGDVVGIVKEIPGLSWVIKSPSQLFYGYGQNIVQGLILGINGQQGGLRSTMTAMANSVANTSMRPTSYPGGSLGYPGGSSSATTPIQLTLQMDSRVLTTAVLDNLSVQQRNYVSLTG